MKYCVRNTDLEKKDSLVAVYFLRNEDTVRYIKIKNISI